MHELAPLIYDLAIMLGLAGIVVLLFQRIKQPVVLGYLIAGMIVGPHTPPHSLVKDIENIHILSTLGVIFLMFSLGLEFSFQKLIRVGSSASITGFIEVILMLGIGCATGIALGWSFYESLFLGAALSISSTTIIIKAIDELKLKTKRFAEFIYAVLIVEDLLAILLLVALSTIALKQDFYPFDLLVAALKLMIVVGGWFLIGYFIVPSLFQRVAYYISQETLTIISVALCLFLVCIAASFNYSTALGAFIMGSILAETILVQRIESAIRPIRDIFAAVFFISIGMLINPTILFKYWPIILLLSLVTIIGKIITTMTATFLTGQSFNNAIRVGFSMAQVGEFSFIIVALGLSLHVTDERLYALIVAVSVITTFTTPYFIRFSGKLAAWSEKYLPERLKYTLYSYSTWVYRTLSHAPQKSLLRAAFLRLFINGIIVAIIFIFINELIFHKYRFYTEHSAFGNTLFLLIALIIASPFIWGMLFSLKEIDAPVHIKTNFSPATFMMWLITLSEIVILSVTYFHAWITLFIFAIFLFVFFMMAFNQIERSYRWFEAHLKDNLKTKDKHKMKFTELAPWDTHLVEVVVGDDSLFLGRTLNDCQIRQLYGVNIVAICRGSKVIIAPRGNERLFAFDQLIVLGNDEQIDAFKSVIEKMRTTHALGNVLDRFTLQSILVNQDNPLVGQSIRDSYIREEVNGLVVGLERNHMRMLNPDPETTLQANDILLMVGDARKLSHLYKKIH